MPLGIDATLRYGLHIPPTKSITQSDLASSNPYNTRRLYGSAADADREPRTRFDPGGCPPVAGRLPLLRARARTTKHHVFFESSTAFDEYLAAHHGTVRTLTAHVALLGHPVSHSLSPRMQNAAFAAARLDWHYSAFDVEDPVAAVGRAARARLRRRQRDDPAQAGCRRRLRRGRRRGGEHARLPRRPRDRRQHRQGDPGGDLGAERLPDRRRRRSADAPPALPADTRVFSRARRLAAGRDRLRPDRERDAGTRRAPRPAARRTRPSSSSPTRPTAPTRRSSRRPVRPAARWSTGSRRSSARARSRSSSGRGSRRRSRSCATQYGRAIGSKACRFALPPQVSRTGLRSSRS